MQKLQPAENHQFIVEEITDDPQYSRAYKTALVKQERICFVIDQVILEQGQQVIIDRQDIRAGVDIHFTELMESESRYRNIKFTLILSDLEANRSNSPYYPQIIESIRDLGRPPRPR